MTYIIQYACRVTSRKAPVRFYIRPEHTANTPENATRFDSAQAAQDFVTALQIPGLVGTVVTAVPDGRIDR